MKAVDLDLAKVKTEIGKHEEHELFTRYFCACLTGIASRSPKVENDEQRRKYLVQEAYDLALEAYWLTDDRECESFNEELEGKVK